MQLKKFLKLKNIKIVDLADRLPVSYAQVHRVVSGKSVPGPKLMTALYVATGGMVTPNDFYDLPPLPPAAWAGFPYSGESYTPAPPPCQGVFDAQLGGGDVFSEDDLSQGAAIGGRE